jgi:hypothetical protein
MAIAFAQAEPETVQMYLDLEERELLRDGYFLGKTDAHRRLVSSKPAYSVARQWAGGAKQHGHLHDELKELNYLLRKAVRDLRECGAEQKALYLERALDHGQ